VERTKANEQQLGYNTNLNIPKRKLEGMLDDQILNMKMEVKLGQLINIGKVLFEMEDEHVPHVCRINIHHKNDF
jgi:hypothetical protein